MCSSVCSADACGDRRSAGGGLSAVSAGSVRHRCAADRADLRPRPDLHRRRPPFAAIDTWSADTGLLGVARLLHADVPDPCDGARARVKPADRVCAVSAVGRAARAGVGRVLHRARRGAAGCSELGAWFDRRRNPGARWGASLARRSIPAHYPLVAATGHVGLLVWHGGFSGTASLKVTTDANSATRSARSPTRSTRSRRSGASRAHRGSAPRLWRPTRRTHGRATRSRWESAESRCGCRRSVRTAQRGLRITPVVTGRHPLAFGDGLARASHAPDATRALSTTIAGP